MSDKSSQGLKMERLAELTNLMLVEARCENWDNVMEIQPQRERMIAEYFGADLNREDEALVVTINHILEVDKEIFALGSKHRERLREEIAKMIQGKSAVKAYLSS